MTRTVGIVGAGISGLTAAAGLRKAGWQVRVFERAGGPAPFGTGLSIWPNALKAFDEVGVGKRIRDAGMLFDRWMICEPNGKALVDHFTGGADQSGPNEPARMVRRAELLEILLEAAGRDVVQFDSTVESIDETPTQATINLVDGSTFRADLVLGADGARSIVRRSAFPNAPKMRKTGLMSARGSVGRDQVDGLPGSTEASETWGVRSHFGIVPLSNERTYWYAVAPALAIDELETTFGSWHSPIPEILKISIAEGDILLHPLDEVPPLEHWTTRRIALLGDAAHAMVPSLGQGACQGIEDAVALVRVLASAEPEDVSYGLARYERVRKPRAEYVQRQSAEVLTRMHRGGVRSSIRNFAMRHDLSRSRTQQVDITVPALPTKEPTK